MRQVGRCAFCVLFCFFSQLLLLGCDLKAPQTAESILRIRRDATLGTTHDYKIYRDTQAALLKSQFVLNSALASNDVSDELRKKGTAVTLMQELEVESPGDTELLVVRLPVGGRTREQTESLLNAVVDAYISEIVNKERLDLVAILHKSRMRYDEVYKEIVIKAQEIKAIAKSIGTLEKLPPGEKIEFGTGVERLRLLHEKLIDLQLQEIEAAAKQPTDAIASANESKALQEKIEFVSLQIEQQNAKLATFQTNDGELDARMETLKNLKLELSNIRQAMSDLEQKIEESSRITVLQKAVCSD